MIEHVQALADPRCADYFQLKDVSLRKKLETERGLYLAESFNVIERALQAGHQPRSFFTPQSHLPRLQELLRAYGVEENVPVYVSSDELSEQIVGFHLHRGALASMHRPAWPDPRSLLTRSRLVLVLENLVDHKNVGAAIRNAAALGFDAVAVTPECADPLYRRAIRVSMGTVFSLPITRLETWPCPELLKECGYLTVGLALKADAVPLPELATLLQRRAAELRADGKEQKVALVIGNEGHGMTSHSIAACDYTCIIPMRAGVDSLNAAAASAVACYALSYASPGISLTMKSSS